MIRSERGEATQTVAGFEVTLNTSLRRRVVAEFRSLVGWPVIERWPAPSRLIWGLAPLVRQPPSDDQRSDIAAPLLNHPRQLRTMADRCRGLIAVELSPVRLQANVAAHKTTCPKQTSGVIP